MISILLSVYNGENYICEMLDSLQSQTLQDFVCYIIDDGSKDNSIDVIKSWINEKDASNRFVFLDKKGKGSAKDSFLFLLKEVESDYYMFADQDDVWLPGKVEETYKRIVEIEKGKTVPSCVFSDMYVTDEKLSIISDSFLGVLQRNGNDLRFQRIMIDNPAAGCTMIINKRLRDMAILLENIDLIIMHDQFIAALAAAFGKIDFINKPLVYYRQHENNEMGADSETGKERSIRNIEDAVQGNFFEKKKAFHNGEINLAKAMISCLEEYKQKYYKCCEADKSMSGNDISDVYVSESLIYDKCDSHIFENYEKIKPILDRLSNIRSKNKLSRIRFYSKNGFDRFKRNLWFLLWV